MENNNEKIMNEISVLVENILLKQILDIYEDVNITSNEKRLERRKVTNEFIESCSKELLVSRDEVIEAVNIVIEKAKWIKEIEELDEEIEER